MPPEPNDGFLENELHEGNNMPAEAEQNNMVVALTAMANEFGASAARRTQRADQLAGDADRMWSIAMTTPTVTAAHAMRLASESGSGRTRAETNLPAATSAAGNA